MPRGQPSKSKQAKARAKVASDFVAGAASKAARPAPRATNAQPEHKDRLTQVTHALDHAAAPQTVDDLRAQMLDLGPKSLELLQHVIDDPESQYTAEHRQKVAMQVLEKLGVSRDPGDKGRANQRADLVTLRAASDRLAKILTKADARSDTRNVQELFG